MDITLQVMVNVPTHGLNPMKAAMRYRNGDILAVYRTNTIADMVDGKWKMRRVITAPRSVFVHITNVPQILAQKAVRRLIERHQPAGETFRRRHYRIPPSVVPQAIKDTLQADKEVTVSWTQAKQVIRRKSVTTLLDPSMDDESVELQDADL